MHTFKTEKNVNKQTNKETQTKKHCTKDCDTTSNKNISVRKKYYTDRGPVRQAVRGASSNFKINAKKNMCKLFWT